MKKPTLSPYFRTVRYQVASENDRAMTPKEISKQERVMHRLRSWQSGLGWNEKPATQNT